MYSGTINGQGLIGPNYGAVVGSTSFTNVNNFPTLWYGFNTVNWSSGYDLTVNFYYTNYTVNGVTFTSSETDGYSYWSSPTVSDNSRVSTYSGDIGYVQGVNRGIYANNMNDMVNTFNNTYYGDSSYMTWVYENGEISLNPRFTSEVTESPAFNYQLNLTDSYNIGNYTYSWYINNNLDTTLTSNTYVTEASTTEDRNILVIMYDGQFYTVSKIFIPKLYIAIEFNINTTNNSVTAQLTGTALSIINLSDYTYQWYVEDITGKESTPISGATTTSLTGLEQGKDYRLIATNNNQAIFSAENTFYYGNDRTVVFVNNIQGSDYNDGFSPTTPVKTMGTAYSKLDASKQLDKNIIVVMGDYTDTDFYTTSSDSTYNKQATLLGYYKGTNYAGNLTFTGDRFLVNDLKFWYLNLNGNNNGYAMFYLQGRNLTVDEGVYMNNYGNMASKDYGQIVTTTPDFHVIAGYLNYNYANIPAEGNNTTLTIKSGSYGRIIAGCRSDNNGNFSTSHNIFGTKSNPYKINIIIDINNSTTPSNYSYDINLLVGGQTDGSIYANTQLDINHGKVGRVLGGCIGNTRTISGYPANSFFGSVKVNVRGGRIEELYGTSLGRNKNDTYFYGTVDIRIYGGLINANSYGAGAGGVTGYNSASTDSYKSYGSTYSTNVNIQITGGTINGNIYGGGYGYSNFLTTDTIATDGGTLYGDSNLTITGGTINGNVYGAGRGYGGYQGKDQLAKTIGNTQINISGSPNISGDIYGAGEGVTDYENTAAMTGNTTVTINTNATLNSNIYGGGNAGKLIGNSTININNGNITKEVYGGGNVGVVNGTSNVYLTGGTLTNAFGGGKSADVSTTNITLQGATLTDMFGGSNTSGTVNQGNVKITSGTASNIYGGNNQGGTSGYVQVKIQGGNVSSAIYGGGNQADTTAVYLTLTSCNNTVTEIYGGGKSASVGQTYIYCNGVNATKVFGGSNTAGTVTTSNVYGYGGTFGTVYGGNNAGGKTLTSNVQIGWCTVTSAVYGGGDQASTGTTTINAGTTGATIPEIYGGGKSADATLTNVNMQGTNATKVFGGSNTSGTVTTSNVTVTSGTIETIYGGNNAGGTTLTTNVTTNGGVINNVFGGGDQAATGTANSQINSTINICVYGGGNQASVNNDTTVNLNNALVKDNIYGGGNQGTVNGNTNVHIYNSKLQNSLYAGGNGIAAVVLGNTNLIMDGTSNEVTKNVFGGGNQAATGVETSKTSSSNVKIANGKIGGNVYGGANTSVVYGVTNTKIGYDAVNDTGLTLGNIEILGTVFGGGEANASGSEVYDFSFISVTNGININIDANNHETFYIKGSIFGSGNASSTSGESFVNIKNYGTATSPKANVSIQRATTVTLDNSAMRLSGATDRTNEYSSVYFTISRVDEVKLKNSATLYLNCGANLLKKFTSAADENGQEVKAAVTINNETGEVTKNADNRIYMAEGKNLNIATNEQVTAYGEVSGMTFFGLFTNTMNPSTSTGLYNSEYNKGDTITNAGTFSSNSYVIGQHKANHDTTIDGFYSNYNNEGVIDQKYIDVTPEDDVYYIWLIGEKLDVTSFEVSLVASKYATLGTYELGLTGFSNPNLKFILNGFSAGLADNVELINPDNIENVAADLNTANNNYGLSMKSGNNGWKTKGTTTFLTADGGSYQGTKLYSSDNSTSTPALNFCLYHSENLTLKRDLGTVKIRLQVLTPVDDLNYSISYIDVNITLSSALYQNDFYEAAISPGEEFGLFTTTETNITDKSKFSTYYSLYIEDFSQSDYYVGYNNYKRVIVSRDSSNRPYVLPENTKITMFDMVTNKYYYYVVTLADQQANKYVYYLADFVAMGSNNEKYNETNSLQMYYNTGQDLIYENFIFHIDFEEAQLNSDITNNNMLMELRDTEDQTLIGVLGIQRTTMVYSVYKNKQATIDVTAQTNTNKIYLGKTINLNVTTDFKQSIVDSKTVYDTNYFDKKMGIKLSIYDSNGNKLNSDSLLGISFTLDDINYYPRVDGSVRINIADKVSNVLSKIKINTANNKTLATGDYKIRVETFGSPDGIYYGLTSSDMVEVPVTIINSAYGLKVHTDDQSKVINKDTGQTLNGNNSLISIIDYSSGLSNPKIVASLYRRDYSSTYSQDYELVDLKDYITDNLAITGIDKEYLIVNNPVAGFTQFMTTKTNLKTGTYKLTFKLYDGDSYIGEAYEYFVIK